MSELTPVRTLRRKRARLRVLVLLPILLIMGSRFFFGPPDGDGSSALLWSLAVASGVFLLVVLLFVITMSVYHSHTRNLAALADPGSWTAPCVDPDDPQRWQWLVIEDAGVRLVGRSGVSRRGWRWESIEDVTVERLPVGLMTRVGVVLHLADGVAVDMVLPTRACLAYPLARQEEAANEVRQRLAAFRARSASAEAPPQ